MLTGASQYAKVLHQLACLRMAKTLQKGQADWRPEQLIWDDALEASLHSR
jgi:hypothetical protein